ncbi:hypothetical protein [Plantactinospora sp. WMMB782]|uniref:hypothetical protein n=1 Tax=Plantactinospora sp. WMMB782 TaxID=3404121 RepID=UPI003B9517DA
MALNRRSVRILAVSGSFVLAAALWGSPAQAHEMRGYHGLDEAWVYASHLEMEVRDDECDGHKVFAVVNLRDGRSTSIVDDDGCSGNTGGGRWSVEVASFYVCEDREGCGTTVRVS